MPHFSDALRFLAPVLLGLSLWGGLSSSEAPPAQNTTAPADTVTFDEERASFSVQFQDVVIPYRVFGIFVMPGETSQMEVLFPDPDGAYALQSSAGTVSSPTPGTWAWTAPAEPGLYSLSIADTTSQESIRLNAFVLTPFDHSKRKLNGFRIGRYEEKPLRGDPAYNRPPGFFEVTPELEQARVSPHFRIGQFLCKQSESYPQYLILREPLLLKLEMILQEVNEAGSPANTLHVMSGFRTPYYNRSIGNRTSYSRHLYGGAADVFVDTDNDNYMDDLTNDGSVTTADARTLARIVEDNTDESWYKPLAGGLGIYSPASHRGPFVHVDVRGYRARW